MSCGYAHVISHTDARMKYQNRGPIANIITVFLFFFGVFCFFVLFVIYFFFSVVLWFGLFFGGGPPPLGGVTPLGGDPPRGGPPPLIKDRFYRKIRKRRGTKPAIRAFWTPKTLFLGVPPKSSILAVFRGFGGYPGGTPQIGVDPIENRIDPHE
jgi:hypothetical protein